MPSMSIQNRSPLPGNGRRDSRAARERLVEQARITQRRLSMRRGADGQAGMRSAA
jgi:hypothetical protein